MWWQEPVLVEVHVNTKFYTQKLWSYYQFIQVTYRSPSTVYGGPFKCYVTPGGMGGCMTQRYVALHGGGGVLILALRNACIYFTR